MFYKAEDLVGKFFDERLEKCTLGGYALGEDLFFTLNLSLAGKKLFAVPNINLTHIQPQDAPSRSRLINYAKGELRAHLLQEFPHRFRKSEYLGSLVVEAILILIRSPKYFLIFSSQTLNEIRGFVTHLNRGIHD